MFDQPFAAPAMIFFVLAIPLAFRIIPRNRFYGVRTARTLADERLWYRANSIAGWLFMLSSLIYLGTAHLYPYAKYMKNDLQILIIHLAAFILPLAAILLLLRSYIRQFR